MMRCRWTGCLNQAEYVIVYGCLQGHLRETWYCFSHCADWANLFEADQIPCLKRSCHLKADQWDYTSVKEVRMQL